MNIKDEEFQIDTWGLFLKIHSISIQKIDETLKSKDLIALNWYDILLVISKSERNLVPFSTLLTKVVLTKSGLSRSVKSLEKSELIVKVPSKEDKRAFSLSLTVKGKKMKERVWKVYKKEIFENFANHLEENEMKSLYGILNKLKNRIVLE